MNKIFKCISNIKPEDDCCGKWDLDCEFISISTRCWEDNTAKCSFILDMENQCITILESDYLKATSKSALEKKCKKWYKENMPKLLNTLLKELEK